MELRRYWLEQQKPDPLIVELEMPFGSTILNVEGGRGTIGGLVAAVYNPDARMEKRRFQICGVGGQAPPATSTYVGCFDPIGTGKCFYVFEL